MQFNDTVALELDRDTVLSIITEQRTSPLRDSLMEQVQVPTEVELTGRQVMEMVDALRHESEPAQKQFRAHLMTLVDTPPLRCPQTFPHKTCGPFENAEEVAGHLRTHYRGSDETFDPEIAMARANAAVEAWQSGLEKARQRQANVIAGRHPDAASVGDDAEAFEDEEDED